MTMLPRPASPANPATPLHPGDSPAQSGLFADEAEAAREYHRRGLEPTPLGGRQTKAPNRPGWQHERYTPENAGAFLGQNIGLILGMPSGGLADVDLECPEAVRVADVLLPETDMVSGRAGNPRSHRLFRIDSPTAHRTFRDPCAPHGKKATLVELRTGSDGRATVGQQTMVPPSIHPSGDAVVWHEFGGPARVGAADLDELVRLVAAAALLGRHWSNGKRHHAALALAGGLLRLPAWNIPRVERFVRAVCAAAEDEESPDRLACVRATADNLQDGKNATGWSRLSELIGGRVVARVKEWLGICDTPRGTAGGATPPPAVPEWVPFPTHLLPSVLAAYVAAVGAAYGCDETYSSLPLLAAMAAAVGTTHQIAVKQSWFEPPAIWAAAVGLSGSGKTPPHNDVDRMCQDINDRLDDEHRTATAAHEAAHEEWQALRDAGAEAGPEPTPPASRTLSVADTTIEALVEVLQDNPRGVLVNRDELAGWIGGFTRYTGKAGASDVQNWLQLSNAGTVDVRRKTGDRKKVRVRGAAVSVCGTIQPAVLARAMTPELRATGLFARLLLAYPPPRKRRWSDVEVPADTRAAVVALLDRLHALTHGTRADGRPAPKLVRLSTGARQQFVAFFDRNGEAVADAASEDERASLSKLEAYAARFALLFHCSRYPDAPDGREVSGDDMAAAVALAEWFADESARVYQLLAEPEERRESRTLAEQVAGKAQRLGGTITARQLQNSNSKRYPSADAATATLEMLVAAGFGTWEELATTGGGHHPRHYRPTVLGDSPAAGHDDEEGDRPDTPSDTRPAPVPTPDGDATADTASDSGEQASTQSERVSEVSDCRTNPTLREQNPTLSRSGPALDRPASAAEPAFLYVTDDASMAAVADAVRAAESVGLDVETTGLNPRCGRLRLLQLATPTGTYVIDADRVSDLSSLFAVLAEVEVVGHNLQFELTFLMPVGFVPGRLFDTMLASQVLDAGDTVPKHNLADVCKRHLNIDVEKDEQTSDWSGPLTGAQLRYAALDAVLPLRLRPVLAEKLAAAKLTHTAALENRALPAVARMAVAGVVIDRPAWLALAAAAEAELPTVAADMNALLNAPVANWNSPAQVKAAFAAIDVPLADTREETLAGIAHPLADLLRRYRSAAKRGSCYGAKWLAHVAKDDRVYPGWGRNFTATGRMSCGQPNMQQLPRDVRYRRCVVAPAGRVLVKADYSQIELRIAAALANEPAMIAAYERGDDLHRLTAAAVLGKSPDAVTKEDRQLAKAVNFGLLYGGGAEMLVGYARQSYGVTLTVDQATAYRAAFFRTYPKLAVWHHRVGRVNTPIDTRTRGGRRRKAVGRFTEKLNTPVQGTGADGLKTALALLWERRHEQPSAFPVLAVHDEIVIECDAADAGAVATWLAAAMTDGMTPFCDPVPVAVEAAVARTWGGD